MKRGPFDRDDVLMALRLLMLSGALLAAAGLFGLCVRLFVFAAWGGS